MRDTMMKRVIIISMVMLFCMAPAKVMADDYWGALTECIDMATTKEDKVLLAQWVGYSIAQHPALREKLKVLPEELQQIDLEVGKLYVRLFGDVCHDQSVAVIFHEKMTSRHNYEYFKQLAMRTLFSDPSVEQSFINVDEYIFKHLPSELE